MLDVWYFNNWSRNPVRESAIKVKSSIQSDTPEIIASISSLVNNYYLFARWDVIMMFKWLMIDDSLPNQQLCMFD